MSGPTARRRRRPSGETPSVGTEQGDDEHRQRLAALGQLAATLGHDAAQPMTLVLASLEALLHGASEPGHILERQARDAALVVREILGGIRTLAGAAHGGGETELGEVLRLATVVAGPYVRTRAALSIEAAASCARVPLNRTRLVQVLVNLLMNAAEAFDELPRKPRRAPLVRVTSARVRGAVVLEIRDNGRGISAAVLPRIFDPFFTTRLDRGGTGLGLYSARRIVEECGGKLALKSREGAGTVARLQLPLVAP